ncbi:hypothetical protein KZC56_11550 [Microbacterium sp. SSW1-47]|uniref:hypothetical protein n=1 Tax=Microbacterium sufflavum TaxID=2851649 RepID=UPI001FFD6E7C|nr:hypothetical protein [Microbacterium sufflavum]MCK2026937.1 hypothetical protein [Microbacterium sufflavum]
MTDPQEPQPELRWAPLPPTPERKGRVWLIVGLSVLALAIIGALLFFLLPRGDGPTPAPSASPSPSSTPTPTETPTPTATPTAGPQPSQTPIVTQPPVVDPTVEAFRGQVSGPLADALRGLDIVAGASGQDALPVVDTLQEDARRLSDLPAPSSIADSWRDGTASYTQRLSELRTAITDGGNTAGAVDAARTAAQSLRSLVGL